MKALSDYSGFVFENAKKFHNLIKDEGVNEEKLNKQVETFVTELYNRAGESIDVSIDILDTPNADFETIIALLMQASELWYMFCEKYGMMYPDDPPYFDETAVLKAFKSAQKERNTV